MPLPSYRPPRWFLAIVLTISFLHIGFLLTGGFHSPDLPADVAIVPGTKLHPDGQPSSGLRRRLERALQIFRAGGVKAILVSGGRGVEGFEEAGVMRDVLIQGGIPPDKIITDGTGNNTRLTAIHAAEIRQANHWRSAVVMSQYYHVPRAKPALRQQGIQQVSGAAAEYRFAWTGPISIVRECAGLLRLPVERIGSAHNKKPTHPTPASITPPGIEITYQP